MQSKTPTVQFANAIGGYFVAVVLLLAGITLLAWWSTSVETALNHAMALLIVACPCALGLATPFTVAIAQARAATADLDQVGRRGWNCWRDRGNSGSTKQAP
ncbi:MAG: hypothetical protein R3C12_16395 [Planctomycetaceae bacterium]